MDRSTRRVGCAHAAGFIIFCGRPWLLLFPSPWPSGLTHQVSRNPAPGTELSHFYRSRPEPRTGTQRFLPEPYRPGPLRPAGLLRSARPRRPPGPSPAVTRPTSPTRPPAAGRAGRPPPRAGAVTRPILADRPIRRSETQPADRSGGRAPGPARSVSRPGLRRGAGPHRQGRQVRRIRQRRPSQR
jgi:hypothetical protein